MKRIEEAKNTYRKIEIPKELNEVVEYAFQDAPHKKKSKVYNYIISVAAVIIIGLTIGLNTSESFAMEVQSLPVIGSVAKILTIRSYEKAVEDKRIEAKIPAIVEKNENDKNVTNKITDINAEIQRLSDEYIQDAEQRAEEYRQAFLETGGTEEEWEEHNIEIKVDYEIKAETENYLSFVLYGTESWISAYAEAYWYNLDLQTGEAVKLEDVLGEDYIALANESILVQMQERMAADKDLIYFDESMDGFTTVTEETKFYMNEAGNPVIVFDKYEIAPGAFGMQEFEIKIYNEEHLSLH